MKFDPFYDQIISGLENGIDPDTFEVCVVELVRSDGFAASPIVGGQDGGFDGAVADGDGEAYPIIVTTRTDCIGNLKQNLRQYLDNGGKRRKAIFATTQSLTPRRQRNLRNAASELGFTLVHLYEQAGVAAFLYRNPEWAKELLQITGTHSALSPIPFTTRPDLSHTIVGRDDAISWLQTTTGDRLLVGEPGSGKTALLRMLVESHSALFLIDKDLTAVANAIRKQQPKIIMIDDAHIDSNYLVELIRLRSEIGASFEIVATSWVGDKDLVAAKLGLSAAKTYELRRISRDQVVEVISNAGIKGIDWLVAEIVNQAEGLPGLAVTLTHLCLQGSSQQIHRGDAILSAIMNFYVRSLNANVKELLATFAIGGNAGMQRAIVSRLLDISPIELSQSLAIVEAGGVITQVNNVRDQIKVRPPALRQALIREVFFSGVSGLSSEILDSLISYVPDTIETTLELIHTRARGGRVPRQLIENNLLDSPTAWKIWSAYSWLGYPEATWVLDNFKGPTHLIAYSTLENNPQKAIPKLISEAVGDNRLLNATPEHPIRKLQSWIQDAYPGTGEPVRRRRLLFKLSKNWLLDNPNEHATGIQILLSALDPRFERHKTDPGSGNTFTIQSAYLTIDELSAVHELWIDALELAQQVHVTNWQPFVQSIREWTFPYRNHDENVGTHLRELGKQIALRLAEQAEDQPQVLYDLRNLMGHIIPDFDLKIDYDIEVLYPREDLDEDWKMREQKWSSDLNELADQWQSKKPEAVVNRLAEIENKMLSARRAYPRLTSNLAYLLSSRTDEPLTWARLIITSELPGDVYLPFLDRVVSERVEGWQIILEESFSLNKYRYYAMQVVFKQSNLPKKLSDLALDVAPEYTQAIEFLYMRDQISEVFLVDLLHHPNLAVAGAAAEAEWKRKDRGSVRDDLRTDWEQAVLDSQADDFWFADIFKKETDLGYRWLAQKLQQDMFPLYRYDRAVATIISGLNHEQRRDILFAIPVSYGYSEMVAQLIDDEQIYKALLNDKRLKSYHLAPLAGELNDSWKSMAKLAYEAGYSPQEIASRTMIPVGVVVTWSGKRSDQWKQWLTKFEELISEDDTIVALIAQAGCELSALEMEDALQREFNEDVYGRE